MFKTILAGSACLLLSSPALAAGGPALTGEIIFGDTRSDQTNSTEYNVKYWDTYKYVNFGAELQVLQLENAGALNSTISAKVGPVIPKFVGITPVAYVELGSALNQGDNYAFWGVAVGASTAVYGPVSANIGYRHREGFENGTMNEERLNGGISVALNSDYSLGAQYYLTRGTTDSDTVGLSVTRKF